jgi:hypothetical protein
MMKVNRYLAAHGQSLVLVALAMVVFLGVLGLVLDGGYTFAMRRQAQNAADAGALAGVRMLCEPDPDNPASAVSQASSAVDTFVTNNNVADYAASINPDAQEVIVTTTIDVDTFFAHFVGIDVIPVQASAAAECFSPSFGRGILPIAWNCRPPVTGLSDSETCQQERIDWETLQDYIDTPQPVECINGVCPGLYIVMDNLSLLNSGTYGSDDFFCREEDPAGQLICDLDGDSLADRMDNSARSWLDLDGALPLYDCVGGGGASELSSWITGGFPCPFIVNSWTPDASGDISSLYGDIETRRRNNPLVIVPIFDHFCEGDPRNPASICRNAGFQPGDIVKEDPNRTPDYFRIFAFSAFYITCVRRNNGDRCPGADQFLETNVYDPQDNPAGLMSNGDASSYRSVEGYFLEGYIPGLGGRLEDDVDTGVYTYYLSR